MRTKRMLSMLLSLCVLLCCVTITIPAAAAETELLFEDFEDKTLKVGEFWGGSTISVLPETLDGYGHLTYVTSADGETKTRSCTGGRWGSVTSGNIRLTFEFEAKDEAGTYFYLKYYDANYTVLFLQNGKLATGVTNVNTPFGAYDLNTSYIADVVVNAATGAYTVSVAKKDGTGEAATSSGTLTKGTSTDNERQGVNGYEFSKWGGSNGTTTTTLIDNVKVVSGYEIPVEPDEEEPDEEDSNVLISEDFEDSVAATTADGNLQFNFGNGGSVLRDPIDGVAHVSRTVSGGTGTANGQMGARWGSVTSGKMKFSFDIKANCNGVFAGGLMWDNQQNPTIYIKGDTVAAGYNVTNVNNPIGKITQGVWYTVEHIVDASAKTYSVTIKDKTNNAIVCGAYDLSFADAATAPADNRKGANGFKMASWNPSVMTDGTYEYLVDNIYAEKNYTETDADLVLVNDNMDGLTVENMASRGYNFNRATSVSGAISSVDTYGNVIDLSRESATVGIDKNFTYATAGAYKISFDVYRNGGGNFIVFATDDMTSNNSDKDRTCLAYIHDATAELNSSSTTGENPRVTLTSAVPKNDWFTFEAVLNFGRANDTTDDYKITSIYDKNGQLIASKKIDNLWFAGEKTSINSLSRLQILNWSDSTKLYIDNLKVSRYYPVPELSNTSVEIEYYDGTKAESITTLKPEIKSFKFDFGCEAAEAGTIALTEENGSTVTLTGTTADKQVYTAESAFLKPGKKYTLEVSGFANSRGTQMDEFTAVINTTEGTLYAEMTTVSADKVSDLTKDDTLTVTGKYLNSTLDDGDLVWIIAYYEGNELKNSEIKTGKALASSYNNTLETTFTVKDMTDIDNIKIFLWNGIKVMIPYCEAEILD